MFRSHTDKTILLVRLGERYVPIAEAAVVLLPEVEEREEEEREERRGEERGARASDRVSYRVSDRQVTLGHASQASEERQGRREGSSEEKRRDGNSEKRREECSEEKRGI